MVAAPLMRATSMHDVRHGMNSKPSTTNCERPRGHSPRNRWTATRTRSITQNAGDFGMCCPDNHELNRLRRVTQPLEKRLTATRFQFIVLRFGVSDMFLPHQQRVIDEKKELDDKATKLSQFIGTNPLFETIDAEEQERMKEQCEIMWQYSEILGKRITAFTA
jgi:hypothetical protein